MSSHRGGLKDDSIKMRFSTPTAVQEGFAFLNAAGPHRPLLPVSSELFEYNTYVSDTPLFGEGPEPASAPSAPAAPIQWEKHPEQCFQTTQLANGLKVVLHQTPVQPVVQTQIVYSFGSNDEIGSSERGLAHICEHMIFKGTKPESSLRMSESDIPGIARLLGASYNAFTTTNCTSYHFQSCPEYTQGFLKVLAASMSDTRLFEQHLRSEKLAVLAEMSNGKDSIFRDALINVRQKMYTRESPQYYPTIGNIKDIAELHSDTLRTFYDRLYRPENATLFVVGDMSDELVADLKKGAIQKWFGGDAKATESILQKPKNVREKEGSHTNATFHTLTNDSAFMLITVPVEGMNTDTNSLLAFKGLESVLFDGTDSRLYRALVTQHTEDLGVKSIGGFTQLDKEFGEYHIIVEGKERIASKVNEIKGVIAHALLTPFSMTEHAKAATAVGFNSANQRIDVNGMVSGWIDDFKLTGDFGNYWKSGNPWKQSMSTRMNELRIAFDDNASPVHSIVYTAPPKALAEQQSAERIKEWGHYKTILSDFEHVRSGDYPLEVPIALGRFQAAFEDTKCQQPYQPNVSQQGAWTHVSAPVYQFVKVGIRPRQHAKMNTNADGTQLSMIISIMEEAFPQEEFKRIGLRGGVSPGMAVVASFEAENASGFRRWVDTYASQLTEQRQQQLIQMYTSKPNFFKEKWNFNNEESQMDPQSKLTEYVQQQCSDNYYMDGFKDTWERTAHEIENFDLSKAIATWNKYWGDTEQFISQNQEAACDLEAIEMSDVEMTVPRTLPPLSYTNKLKVLSVKGDGRLNQSLIAIARPGRMNKSNMKYWTVRSIAQNLLFSSIGSRLFKLRESKGLFYSASGTFSADATLECNGYDIIEAKVAPGSEVFMQEKLKAFVRENFGRILENPIQPTELSASKRTVINYWRKLNTESSVASSWASHSPYFTSFVEAPHSIIDEVQKVTIDDVHDFLRKNDREFTVSVMCK